MMTDHLEELEWEVKQENNIEDYLDEDEATPSRYDITSYGIDFDVDGIVKRLGRGDIFIPDFQRNFVWNMAESSRFIESLLLGLPVPGIFLAQEPDSGKMLVIDGQQRLLSLKFFFDGYFKPKVDASSRRVFKLAKVQDRYENKTYETLEDKDRINLENSVLHATVVKQDSPADDDTSIYHIFQRLNTGGRKLAPQEIRTAVYRGSFIDMLKELNGIPEWRTIFGMENDRMKDRELILRFFAMLEKSSAYRKPMVAFLNDFLNENRNINSDRSALYRDIFIRTICLFNLALGPNAFRPTRALNTAVFEASMVGLARRIRKSGEPDVSEVKRAYDDLNSDYQFKEFVSQSTTDAKNVFERLRIATMYFGRA